MQLESILFLSFSTPGIPDRRLFARLLVRRARNVNAFGNRYAEKAESRPRPEAVQVEMQAETEPESDGYAEL